MTYLNCQDPKGVGCSWSGHRDELVSLTDALNDVDFDYCPDCSGKDFEEEEDEREE